ncbi:hypothetical protein J2S13_000557 [Oikeobacillus pervagus]|uniref:Sporulation protein n=1 Tax=Oikeobacillus pervagus TaxID=1325931 RepID=A0AAJ1T2N2_9BACI|nr:hypothetical protein [Oikeobacillus pervagus]MDQ0214161.1 hypothetical protein [Oikeobacillus pervagus]
MKFLIAICMSLSLLTACQMDDNEGSLFSQREDRDGTRFVTNKDRDDLSLRNVQTDRTNTNQNPNFIDLSTDQPTRGTDINKAREVVELFTNYEAGPVWINGRQMYVTVYTDQDAKQSKDAEASLKKKLTKALPRYQMNVNIRER